MNFQGFVLAISIHHYAKILSMKTFFTFILIFLSCFSNVKALERFIITQNDTVVGDISWHTVSKEDTLLDIARYYDLGYNQIILANPNVDPWLPPVGKPVLIPSSYVLPSKRAGLVVNLAEMRLYFFRTEGSKKVVYTAPIGIGTEGKLTKLGVYNIIRKKHKPYWHVPESIRKEDPSLPEVVPPGPDNPLGEYALYLSRESYAIHGTNRPWGIGRRVSHGCIRLYPEDIEPLYSLVEIGTPVFIIYQPYKLGIKDKKIYLQAFPDFAKKISNPLVHIVQMANTLQQEIHAHLILDLLKIKELIKNPNGIPTVVGKCRWGRQ